MRALASACAHCTLPLAPGLAMLWALPFTFLCRTHILLCVRTSTLCVFSCVRSFFFPLSRVLACSMSLHAPRPLPGAVFPPFREQDHATLTHRYELREPKMSTGGRHGAEKLTSSVSISTRLEFETIHLRSVEIHFSAPRPRPVLISGSLSSQ